MPATTSLLQNGRYSIEQEISSQENRLRFEAVDTKDESRVSIVEVPLNLPKVVTASQREALAAEFRATAERLASFDHNLAVPVRSYFTEAGRNYLVCDRVEGVDLASELAGQNEPLSLPRVAAWADAMLNVLNAMHNLRPPMVHGGVRPENLVLLPDDRIRLNMAAVLAGDERRAGSSQTPLAYAPLEQIWSGLDAASQKVIISKYDESSEKILKQPLDAKSDLYSLGAALYHLLTGQLPLDAMERSIEMIEGHRDPLQPPNKLDPAIPVEVSDVVMKAMEVKREYRFDSAAIMRQVLKTALVRVKEREAEEALIERVEQADVRPATQGDAAPQQVVADKLEEEDLASKLREAEEKRLEAERRAAEAEKKLRDSESAQPARATETFTLADLENDDVLGILDAFPHTSEPPAAKPAPESVPGEIAAEPLTTEITADSTDKPEDLAAAAPAEPAPEDSAADPATANLGEEIQPETQKASAASSNFAPADDHLFTEHQPSGGLGLTAVAAAAVVLVAALIGAWYLLGSKPAEPAVGENPAATRTEPSPRQEPAREPETQAPESPSSTTAAAPAAAEQPEPSPEAVSPEQQHKAASTAPARKKPPQAAAKTPAQKKPVTVDDLINDN